MNRVVKDVECGAALLSLCETTANTTCYFVFISPLPKEWAGEALSHPRNKRSLPLEYD
jgi:hypothetical protein